MTRKLLLGAAMVTAMALAGPADAIVAVLGAGYGTGCYQSALNDRTDYNSLRECSTALAEEGLGERDRAATYVNRGIIHLNRGDYTRAMADFDSAIATHPALAEGYTHRGLALLRQNDNRGAIEAISRGLELDPAEPEKALYNRAVAYEQLNDYRSAYRDYRRAAELAPRWDIPRLELARFEVRQR